MHSQKVMTGFQGAGALPIAAALSTGCGACRAIGTNPSWQSTSPLKGERVCCSGWPPVPPSQPARRRHRRRGPWLRSRRPPGCQLAIHCPGSPAGSTSHPTSVSRMPFCHLLLSCRPWGYAHCHGATLWLSLWEGRPLIRQLFSMQHCQPTHSRAPTAVALVQPTLHCAAPLAPPSSPGSALTTLAWWALAGTWVFSTPWVASNASTTEDWRRRRHPTTCSRPATVLD